MSLKDSIELGTVGRPVELGQWDVDGFLFLCMCEKAGSSILHIPESWDRGCREGR